MRTKTLLIAAAALAAAVTSSQAQSTVYSQNIVGYINTSLAPGYNLVANQLNVNNTNGASGSVRPSLPDGTYSTVGIRLHSQFVISIYGLRVVVRQPLTIRVVHERLFARRPMSRLCLLK